MAESPFEAEPIPGGRRFRFQVQAQRLVRQQKQAVFGQFSLVCDEGLALGGDDSAPPPLAYFASALAFWLLTQLARVSETRHVLLDSVAMTVTPTFETTGSILADTAVHRLTALETKLELRSAAPREEVQRLVATAERMCFVLDAIERPHTVHRITFINGAPLDWPPLAQGERLRISAPGERRLRLDSGPTVGQDVSRTVQRLGARAFSYVR